MRMISMAAAVTLAANAASAANVTFDGLPDEGAQVTSWSEDGVLVTANGGVLATYNATGTAHLDDFGTGHASSLSFSTGGVFAATSFDILPDENFYDANFANVAVTGYANGSVVASDAFDMFAVNGTYSFSDAFGGLDLLVIGFAAAPPGLVCDDAPCTHYSVDNVSLAPAVVPLPASGMLLAFGLMGLVGAYRLRR